MIDPAAFVPDLERQWPDLTAPCAAAAVAAPRAQSLSVPGLPTAARPRRQRRVALFAQNDAPAAVAVLRRSGLPGLELSDDQLVRTTPTISAGHGRPKLFLLSAFHRSPGRRLQGKRAQTERSPR